MREKPNYFKEALKEPYNIWGVFISLAASVYTWTAAPTGWGDLAWVPLAFGGVAETIYLTTVPAMTAYRRVVDRRARRREMVERGRKREELIKGFDPREREAVEYLRWMKNQIYQNYQKFTRLDDIPDDIQKLESIWESYVDMLDNYRRRKNHLRSTNLRTIQNQMQQTDRSIQTAPDDATKRLYEKNLAILQKRLKTYDDMERSMKRVEAELQSIEHFFGLVNDQVVVMPSPEHISSLDFDSLLSSIELTKEILDQTAPVISQLDAAERSTEMRPPVAQRQ